MRTLVAAIVAAWTVALAITPSRGEEPDAKSGIRVERDLVYATVGDTELLLDAYLPEGDGPFPAVMLVHGGGWRSGNKHQLVIYAVQLARRGYVAMAINYRLAPQFKHPAQIEDCRRAFAWIREHAGRFHIDRDRIGAMGYSAGGHLVALLAAEPEAESTDEGASSDGSAASSGPANRPELARPCCVVAGGAPCDFRNLSSNSRLLSDWLGGSGDEIPEVYERASPITYVSADDPPMFFYHGSADELVNVDGARRMVTALQDAGVEADLHLVEGGRHISTVFNIAALHRALDFFDRHLKQARAASGG